MLPTITDDQVTLRPWRTSDAGDLQRAMQDPDTVRLMAIDLPYTLEDASGFIDGTVSAWERREAAHFAVAGADDGLIGYLGVTAPPNRSSSAVVSTDPTGQTHSPLTARSRRASRRTRPRVRHLAFRHGARRGSPPGFPT